MFANTLVRTDSATPGGKNDLLLQVKVKVVFTHIVKIKKSAAFLKFISVKVHHCSLFEKAIFPELDHTYNFAL